MSLGPAVRKRQSSSVITITTRNKQRKFEFAVTQRDLAEERLLAAAAARALDDLDRKRKHIVEALEKGEEIEPGIRSAKLIPIAPKPYSVTPKPYKKLVVR